MTPTIETLLEEMELGVDDSYAHRTFEEDKILKLLAACRELVRGLDRVNEPLEIYDYSRPALDLQRVNEAIVSKTLARATAILAGRSQEEGK